MGKPITLFIDNEGDLHAIHNKFVDGLDVGTKVVERVSDVEFDNEKQEWYAEIRPEFDSKGPAMRCVAPTRDEVLELESEYVTDVLRMKVGDRVENCDICGKPVPGFRYQYCCDGRECGCMGQAIEPCLCSEACSKAMISLETDDRGDFEARRIRHNIPKWINDKET